MGEAKTQDVTVDEARYNAEIGKRIEDLRKRRGVSGVQLARAARMSRQRFYDCETGKVRWRPLHLRLISDYLRVAVEELLPKSTHLTYKSPI